MNAGAKARAWLFSGSRAAAALRLSLLGIALLAIAIAIGIGLRSIPAVQDFIEEYHGESSLPDGAPVGFPAWLAWQHFFNAFFMTLIVRTGLIIRSGARPDSYWSPRSRGRAGAPTKISLNLWLHLALDIVWVVNGIVFYVLLFATGQWMRVIPTSWDVIPHSISVAIQYASLNWPVENGWHNYNALQLIAYGVTIFVAAPLAVISGLRMSPFWGRRLAPLDRVIPLQLARRIHFPVMIYFVLFTIAHVTLVLATGALRNLNHMFATRDDESWIGAAVFAASIVATAVGWVLARPIFVRPVASLTGSVTKR